MFWQLLALIRRNFVMTCWILLLMAVVIVFSQQNHTSYSRNGSFSVVTDAEMDLAYPIHVAGDGNPHSEPAVLPPPTSLAPIAKKYKLERKAGLNFFGRGHDTSFAADIPEFHDQSKFLKLLSRQLHTEYQTSAIEFAVFDWSLVYDGLRNPEFSLRNWDRSINLDFVHLSPRSASMLETQWEYTGGAHGNCYYIGRCFVEENGDVRELKLEDLFEPTSDWERRLVNHCVSDLKCQGASHMSDVCVEDPESVDFSTKDLPSFTLSSEGLRFYFSPYHVGCYAEGMYNVRVPYSVIRDCLSESSPARMFMTPESR